MSNFYFSFQFFSYSTFRSDDCLVLETPVTRIFLLWFVLYRHVFSICCVLHFVICQVLEEAKHVPRNPAPKVSRPSVSRSRQLKTRKHFSNFWGGQETICGYLTQFDPFFTDQQVLVRQWIEHSGVVLEIVRGVGWNPKLKLWMSKTCK